jgi:hypothetical protein
MPNRLYTLLLVILGLAFTLLFATQPIPAVMRDGDVIGAFAAGFVNPYASGYALGAITCWCILSVWVIHEARTQGIRHGWIAIVLGVVPGVATGLAYYLLLRQQHQQARPTR